jgi:hypothetical protein
VHRETWLAQQTLHYTLARALHSLVIERSYRLRGADNRSQTFVFI